MKRLTAHPWSSSFCTPPWSHENLSTWQPAHTYNWLQHPAIISPLFAIVTFFLTSNKQSQWRSWKLLVIFLQPYYTTCFTLFFPPLLANMHTLYCPFLFCSRTMPSFPHMHCSLLPPCPSCTWVALQHPPPQFVHGLCCPSQVLPTLLWHPGIPYLGLHLLPTQWPVMTILGLHFMTIAIAIPNPILTAVRIRGIPILRYLSEKYSERSVLFSEAR